MIKPSMDPKEVAAGSITFGKGRRKTLRGIGRLCFCIMAGCVGAHAIAADFPDRPITLIVPWTPGGSSDVVMRALAETASRSLGQPIVVVNKPGAGGTLGPATMAHTAKADGYTIAQIPLSVFRMPHLQPSNYDPNSDFTYIIGLSGYTSGVVVRADAPWKTWKDFVAYAKANPGKVNYATTGNGTTLHITMEQIAKRDGIQWTNVPFKGSAESVSALMGGFVQAQADATSWAQMVDSGKFRLLVTWGEKRTKRWPSVPTLKELGYGIVANSPYGLAGPKGMDAKVVKKLHDAFKKALDDPGTRNLLEQYDQEEFYLTSSDYKAYAKATYLEQKEAIETLRIRKP